MPRTYAKSRRRSGGYARRYARSRTARIKKRNRVLSTRRRYPRYRPLALAGQPTGGRTVRLRYTDKVSLTTTAGVVGTYAFRANSIFDPDYTGTGHQPLGHDQWAIFYNHYRVLGSKITVTMNTNGSFEGVMGILLDDDTTVPTKASTIIEHGRGRYKYIGDTWKTGSTLSNKYSARKFHNVADVKDVGRLRATFGTNPTEAAYYHVWFDTFDNTANPGENIFFVTIDYIVSMEEPKTIAES